MLRNDVHAEGQEEEEDEGRSSCLAAGYGCDFRSLAWLADRLARPERIATMVYVAAVVVIVVVVVVVAAVDVHVAIALASAAAVVGMEGEDGEEVGRAAVTSAEDMLESAGEDEDEGAEKGPLRVEVGDAGVEWICRQWGECCY